MVEKFCLTAHYGLQSKPEKSREMIKQYKEIAEYQKDRGLRFWGKEKADKISQKNIDFYKKQVDAYHKEEPNKFTDHIDKHVKYVAIDKAEKCVKKGGAVHVSLNRGILILFGLQSCFSKEMAEAR